MSYLNAFPELNSPKKICEDKMDKVHMIIYKDSSLWASNQQTSGYHPLALTTTAPPLKEQEERKLIINTS